MNEENSLLKEREAQERLAAARLFKLQEQRLIDKEIEHRRKLKIERKGLEEEEEFLRFEKKVQ